VNISHLVHQQMLVVYLTIARTSEALDPQMYSCLDTLAKFWPWLRSSRGLQEEIFVDPLRPII